MKIKSLLIVSIVILVMVSSMRTSLPLSLLDEFNNEKEWSTRKLEDKLPDYIKEVMNRNKLISWEYNVMYRFDKCFFSSIQITYIDEKELFKSNIISGKRNGLDFLTIYPDLWSDNNLHFEKKAEAVFLPATGKLIEFKLKISKDEWIIIYDSKEQSKI
ncbi:MAG: hypothetical protein ACE5F2_01975 [Candidatus Paceibacteria bacterium]